MVIQRRTVHATLELQSRDRYHAVPFDVEAGTESLEVTIEVTAPRTPVIDLGCEGPGGWRGWSGGSRRSFTIESGDATPGYVPGAIEPGAWTVILGLHSLPAGSADIAVTLETPARNHPDHGPMPDPIPDVVRGSARDLPAPEGMHWFAGDTHAHSLHSDGRLSLWELANEGVRSGLDFLCVTDHNTTSHHAHLPAVGARQGIALVPGQEVTTHLGHANVYGEIGFVDFRRPADRWAHDAARRGGFLSLNHPISGDCSWTYPLPPEAIGVELYHAEWYLDPPSTAPLAWLRATGRPDLVLRGGSDFHDPEDPVRPGLPTTWVCAPEPSPTAILEALREGRTTITAAGGPTSDGTNRPDPMGAPILLRNDPHGGMLALDAQGLVLVDGEGRQSPIAQPYEEIDAPVATGPYRLVSPTRRTLAICA